MFVFLAIIPSISGVHHSATTCIAAGNIYRDIAPVVNMFIILSNVPSSGTNTTQPTHLTDNIYTFLIKRIVKGAIRCDVGIIKQSSNINIPSYQQQFQAVLQTPAGLQSAFAKATLHSSPVQPKSLSYIPIMISYGGRNRAHDDPLVRLNHHRQATLFNSIVPDRSAYIGGFPFSDQSVTRVPSLTRDIQTFIKKKKSA